MSDYIPFKAVAILQTGVVCTDPLFLDSMLFAIEMRDVHGSPSALKPGTLDVEPVPIPLLRKEVCGQWFYACSAGQWQQPTYSGVDHWTKRFDSGLSDVIDFGRNQARVIIEKGEYKAYRMPVYYTVSRSLTWYGVGDIAWIRDRLPLLPFIGKKTDQGWGAVKEWTITAIDEDYSCYKDGVVMRPIPTDGEGVLTGIRPPYWLVNSMTTCIV